MKRIIVSITLVMPVFVNAMALYIPKSCLFAPEKLGVLSILKSEEGFSVIKKNETKEVHSYDIDPILKKLSPEQLTKILATSHIKISQMSNEDYKLSLQGDLRGGGAVGAVAAGAATSGAWALFYYGVGTAAACFTTPAGAVFIVGSLSYALAPVQVVTTKIAAISGGIAGAVATGPV